MRVAGYVRVSTTEQVEGYSISEQTDRITKYCEAKGWNLVDVFTDGGYSGAKLDRPALQKLISECKKYEMVLVYKLDRLSRSQKDTLYLIEDVFKKNDVNFASMQENFDTSTPLGMAMVGILSVFAQLEREQIKERMMMGKNGRAKEGYWMSPTPPIGYNYVEGNGSEKGHLVINEVEAEQVREIYKMYLSGMSRRQITLYMAQTYSNRMYTSISTISKILRNPVYYGVMKWGGELVKGQHEPIIDYNTFEQAQLITNKNKKNNIGKTKHLLTGLVKCGICGDDMVYKTIQKKNGTKYHYYVCRTSWGMNDRLKSPKPVSCKNKGIRAEQLEDAVVNEVKKLKMQPQQRTQKKDHSKQIASIDRQIERAMQLFTLENIELDEVKHIISDLTTRKEALQAQDASESSGNAARIVLQSFDDVFTIGDQNTKIAALRAIIEYVSVTQGQAEIHFNF